MKGMSALGERRRFLTRLSIGIAVIGILLLAAAAGAFLLGKYHIRGAEPVEATVLDVVPYGKENKRMLLVQSARWEEEIYGPGYRTVQPKLVRYYYEGDVANAFPGKEIVGYFKESSPQLLLSLDSYRRYSLFFLVYGLLLLSGGGIWCFCLQLPRIRRRFRYPRIRRRLRAGKLFSKRKS